MLWPALASAALMGLADGVHRAGMCGGIVDALVGATGQARPPMRLHLACMEDASVVVQSVGFAAERRLAGIRIDEVVDADRIQAKDLTRQVEPSDLFRAVLGQVDRLERTGADCIEVAEWISGAVERRPPARVAWRDGMIRSSLSVSLGKARPAGRVPAGCRCCRPP
jgi:hypothetical protein